MYELLQTLSKPNLTGIIATAHHRNDSTETLLLKLLRGVHVSNLVGMEEVSRPNDQPLAVWARPMLHISKNDMKQFLTSQALEWREDSSNDSSKYKRNRIRNELVPLLEDIVGSEELLAKRLENLSSQAKELRDDLLPRAKAYLLENNNTDSFILPEVMGLVEKQALHMWCSTRMHDYALPFNQLQRICRQLENYSDSRRWTLQVGSGWSVIRNRDVLSIIHDTSSPTPERSNASSPQCSNGPTAEHSNA
jgi:tRNA(Ile)-lysidine synthase